MTDLCKFMDGIYIVKEKITRQKLQDIAGERFGDLVKAVVDVEKNILALGGDLHADEEAMLLEQGSAQKDLWGINLYPREPQEKFIEFDSVINIRPSLDNRSRGVENRETRERIVQVVGSLIE